mgnify:CR=1 FL=1
MVPTRDLAARFEAYSDWRRRLSSGISALHSWLAQQELADANVDLTARDVTTCNNPTFVAGNPKGDVFDLGGVSGVAHEAGISGERRYVSWGIGMAAFVVYFASRAAHTTVLGLRPAWPYLLGYLAFLGLVYATYFTGTTGQTLGKIAMDVVRFAAVIAALPIICDTRSCVPPLPASAPAPSGSPWNRPIR